MPYEEPKEDRVLGYDALTLVDVFCRLISVRPGMWLQVTTTLCLRLTQAYECN